MGGSGGQGSLKEESVTEDLEGSPGDVIVAWNMAAVRNDGWGDQEGGGIRCRREGVAETIKAPLSTGDPNRLDKTARRMPCRVIIVYQFYYLFTTIELENACKIPDFY